MTSSAVLSFAGTDSLPAASVNFCLGNVCDDFSPTFRLNNPFIVLPTPVQITDDFGKNSKIINIGFLKTAYDCTFMIHDGPGTFDFQTPGTTTFEKLVYMAYYVKDPKTLTLNGTAFAGQIENLVVPWKAGQAGLSRNASFSFTIGDATIIMGT